jgi:hypothetical protein
VRQEVLVEERGGQPGVLLAEGGTGARDRAAHRAAPRTGHHALHDHADHADHADHVRDTIGWRRRAAEKGLVLLVL